MSKYIKLEDAIEALYSGFVTKSVIEDKLKDLPTIEVSEDCVSREAVIDIVCLDPGITSWQHKMLKDLPSVIPQVPSEDAISREWLIDYFSKGVGLLADNTETIIHGIKSAPSVISQPKEGEWLLDGRCSECLANPLTTHKNYCPNCGAKMRI